MPKTLLLEIGLEELPARFVEPAIQQLKEKMEKWLQTARIMHGEIQVYATPRRLAVQVADVAEQQADAREEVRGPAKRSALDANDKWTPAALGFARGQGVSPDELIFKTQNSIEYVYAIKESKGQPALVLLPEALKQMVESMTFAKNMRWGKYELRYARPIRWLTVLFGDEVVLFTVTGVQAGRTTRGHRFLGGEVSLQGAEQFATALKHQYVIANSDERRALIRSQIEALASEQGWQVPIDESLLDEVNALVEYPTALFGSFSDEFLQIPQDVLITSMREHQRYFPVMDNAGKLLPYFITVRNGDDRSLAQVAKGNEKVLRARLSDARFFYLEDQKLRIEQALAKLENIVYQEKLGTVADKVRRVVRNAQQLSQFLHLDEATSVQVVRAATIAKFDLVTAMVYEFPELQGVMGEDYALKLGESPAVARAIREHYMPRFAGDTIPTDIIGTVVSIADKMDTLVGCFSLGMIPTGSQDPYALRRQTAGIVQMVFERQLPLTIGQLVELACEAFREQQRLFQSSEQIQKDIQEFFGLRVKNALAERNIRYDVADAVMAAGVNDFTQVVSNGIALMETLQLVDFKLTGEALNRVVNISVKQRLAEPKIRPELFEDDSEHALYEAWLIQTQQFREAVTAHRADHALRALMSLEPEITAFFTRVMVMAENEVVRRNRLSLLQAIADDVLAFADFRKLVSG